MSSNQSRTMTEIFNQLNGVTLREKHGGRFYFLLHLTPKMSESAIETLDLSVRSYNCLKRAGFNSIGSLAEYISSGEELKRIRNCGAKSVREIMERLFLYQYSVLSPECQLRYLQETVSLNQERKGDRM